MLAPPLPLRSSGTRVATPAASSPGLALIVSPDEWAARALASVLEPAGYRVLRAATGADAREGARRAQPDVILIAAELEQPSGEELCRELRRDPAVLPATPILGVSAASVPRSRRRGAAAARRAGVRAVQRRCRGGGRRRGRAPPLTRRDPRPRHAGAPDPRAPLRHDRLVERDGVRGARPRDGRRRRGATRPAAERRHRA